LPLNWIPIIPVPTRYNGFVLCGAASTHTKPIRRRPILISEVGSRIVRSISVVQVGSRWLSGGRTSHAIFAIARVAGIRTGVFGSRTVGSNYRFPAHRRESSSTLQLLDPFECLVQLVLQFLRPLSQLNLISGLTFELLLAIIDLFFLLFNDYTCGILFSFEFPLKILQLTLYLVDVCLGLSTLNLACVE